ncbi:MAG: chitobiase/beta-hexosaminidase C-terminal domain-containing protein, partial [Vicinamibacterales bacterium]
MTLRYTTDGSTPTESSSLYSAPLSIATTTTVKAVGFRTNWTTSATGTATYTMNFGTLTAPTLSPGTGTYTSSVDVTLSAMAGATIRYTLDGSTPTGSSTVYTAPITLTTTKTVTAKAFHADYTTSASSAATYTIVVATPTLTPTSGTYSSTQLITVGTPTAGATLTYTLTGADPVVTDAALTSGDTLVVGNYTLKVKAWKTGATSSGTAAAAYNVTGTGTALRLGAGDDHALAVRSDGTAWGWGDNANGQVGDGTTTDRSLAVLVAGVTGATAVAGGANHSLALRQDARVVAWGYNGQGQLGDGTTSNHAVPALVTGLTNVSALATGGNFSLALKSDGTVASWGQNVAGQLGDGSTTNRTTAVTATGLSSITAIDAGANFSVALKSDGSVWTWGSNSNGQLGDGTTTSRSAAASVSGLAGVVAVAAGGYHTLALLSDGTVKAWGSNADGRLGDNSLTQRTTPVSVVGLTNVTALAGGGAHTLALDSSGVVWAWGDNANGQLGDATTTDRWTPVQVAGLPTIVGITAGSGYSLALAQDGGVWAWGRNADGQIGDGTTTQRLSPVEIAGAGMAWKVATPTFSAATGLYTSTFNVTVTCTDAAATLYYTTNGVDPTQADTTVASGGTVGVTQSLTLKVKAFKPGSVSSVVASAAYELQALAPSLTPTSGAYLSSQNVTMTSGTSGSTIRYTLDGSEPTTSSSAYSSPVAVSQTSTVKAAAFKTGWTTSPTAYASYWLSAGTVATPSLTPTAGTYDTPPLVTMTTGTSGATIRYTLDGSDPTAASTRYTIPLVVTSSTIVKAKAFKSGHTPSGVVTAGYVLDAAGAAPTPTITPAGGVVTTQRTVTITGASGTTLRYTTTGLDPTDTDSSITSGSTIAVDQPLVLKVRAWQSGLAPSAVRRADFVVAGAVSAGRDHTVALASDGQVWAWGANDFGQLGDASVLDRWTPVPVMTGVVAIAAGSYHSLAIGNTGAVWSWGRNTTSQLGDGTTTHRTSPVQVAGLSNVIAIAAGDKHSLAVTADGAVWAWGDNTDGAIGDGTTTTRATPTAVVGLSGVTRVAAGAGFSLALETGSAATGRAWAWGKNHKGQLGDGATQTRLIPVHVSTLTAPIALHAGSVSAYAVQADGSVWAWGDNTDGQVGIAGITTTAVPRPVAPLAGVAALTVHAETVLARGADGRIWGWGQNSNGQFGNGAYTCSGGACVTPDEILPLFGVRELSVGRQHVVAVRPDGVLVAAGMNARGQLGNNTNVSSPTLVTVSGDPLSDGTWMSADPVGDGLTTWQELASGLDPLLAVSIGNGLVDTVEPSAAGVHPDAV